MKKALDYVSDYQLKSACKDAICIAPSKVTQMIFAVLEDWYHYIVLTYSFKLVSILHISDIWAVGQTSPIYCRYVPGDEADTKLYCLATEAHASEQPAQGCYLAVHWLGVEPVTSWSLVSHNTIRLHMEPK